MIQIHLRPSQYEGDNMSRTNNKQEYICELSAASLDNSRALADWASIFNSFFNKSNIMVRTNSEGVAMDSASVNDASTALVNEDDVDAYIWHVRFPYMEINDIVHFKLQYYDSSNTGAMTPLRLYMAYTPLVDGSELDWVPIVFIPPASSYWVNGSDSWKNYSNGGKQHTSLHVTESIRGDIFVKVFVKWIDPDTHEIDPNGPSIKMAPLFALLQASHRSPSDNTTRVKSVICAGFSQVRLSEFATGSKFALPSAGYLGADNTYTGSGLSGTATLANGVMMSPSLYFAPDIDTSKTYGVMLPYNMVQSAVNGLKQTGISLSTNTYRQPLAPGPIISDFANSSVSSPIRSQLMVPVMSPFSYYVADNAGLLFYSDTWKQGIGTFNGRQYIFMDNFALLNE